MRVAIITHAFPPSNHANGKRPSYLVKALLDKGWSVDVYTSMLGCDGAVIESMNHPNLTIRRKNDLVVNGLNKLKFIAPLHRAVARVIAAVIWPDFYALWAKNILKQMAKADSYDRIVCFVFPPSVYLASRQPNLVDRKWVFDLQESVTPQYLLSPRRSPLQRKRQAELTALEKQALGQAGHVVYTAATNQEAYIDQNLTDKDKTSHIPYFYDDKAFPTVQLDVPDLFEIRYFGTFDWSGSRSPRQFLTNLAEFLATCPEARSKTKFSFYGSWLTEHDQLIKDLGLEDVTSIHSAVDYGKYLELVSSAPVLLLVVAPEHNLFMPSKIVDYFAADRPILAYVPGKSEMQNVLEEANMAGQVIDTSDATQGVNVLESLWSDYLIGDLNNKDSDTAHWSSSVQLARYIELLDKL